MPTAFEELLQRVQSVFGTLDDTVLIVLKGHLLIEEMLDSIISSFVFHPGHLNAANLRFAQKLSIARSISIDEHDNSMWDIAIRINSLRNELAHALDSAKRKQKTQAVIDAYLSETKEAEHIALIRNQEEHILLAFAASYFTGFLSSFKAEILRFREFVDGVDQYVNPRRHRS